MAMTSTDSPSATTRSRPAWGAALVWLGVLALLALVGFGLIRTQRGPVAVGSRMPDFTLTTFDGQTYDTAKERGRVLVVNFWASWCKPCEQEAAALEEAHRRLSPDGVLFLGVNYVDTEPEALAYLDRFDITYPNGADLGTRVSQAFRIRGVPETYIAGADGILTFVKIGPFESLDEILTAVEAAQTGPSS
jgi:cytochrome c biogenesis protein CcmG/thiol:disulfide interchange protein DsbE